jgi:osmoprotectant transport system ATP-binding protein
MDEPFGATDPITREKLQAEFLRLQESIGKTIVFVTHDFDEAIKLGDRIAVLGPKSKIEQFDTPAKILANPATDYVSSFIGEGAALKRLALLLVSNTKMGAAAKAHAKAGAVKVTDNLREALDRIVLAGGNIIGVQDASGATVGSLSIEQISEALGADVSALGK